VHLVGLPTVRSPASRSPSPGGRGRDRGWSPSRRGWRGRDGHITPPVPVLSATHLPTPVQRCTASSTEPSSWASRRKRRGSRSRAASRMSASTGRGATSTPGLSRSPGSKRCLTAANSAITSAEYIRVSSSERARPSPCSPDRLPPCAAVRSAASSTKERNACRPPAPVEREVDAHVHAAVAEVAVGHPVEPGVAQQRVEPSQVVAEPVRRDRGVLPARVRGPGQAAGRETGTVLRIRQSAAISPGPVTSRASSAPASRATASAAARASSAVDPVTSANSQPAPRGRSGTAPLRRTTSTIRESRPSQATSGWCSRPGTASAASNIVG
jgi:hypothetical protein